jgi:hypothetical protein
VACGIVLPGAMLAYIFQSQVFLDPVAAWHELHLEPGECGVQTCVGKAGWTASEMSLSQKICSTELLCVSQCLQSHASR